MPIEEEKPYLPVQITQGSDSEQSYSSGHFYDDIKEHYPI